MSTSEKELTIAQKKFISRDAMDSRHFETWLHNEDVQRIIWQLYREVPPQIKTNYTEPFVFVDNVDTVSFDEIIDWAGSQLDLSDKLYFPFIFKPETGGAHYMAGIIRQDYDCKKLFLFNPTGYTKKMATARLKLRDPQGNNVAGDEDQDGNFHYGMDLVLSAHQVQNQQKDGGVLVSCGPICIEFLKFALNNPQWVMSLDDKFKLPPQLEQLVSKEQEAYKQDIIALRKAHFETLSKISDQETDHAMKFFAPRVDALLNRDVQNDDEDLDWGESETEAELELSEDSADDDNKSMTNQEQPKAPSTNIQNEINEDIIANQNSKKQDIQKILQTLKNNISQAKNGRFSFFSFNVSSKVDKLQTVIDFLEKQESFSEIKCDRVLNIISEICSQQRNPLGFFKAHSQSEFEKMLKDNNLEIKNKTQYSRSDLHDSTSINKLLDNNENSQPNLN